MISRHFGRLFHLPSIQRLPSALPQVRPHCTSTPFDLDPDQAADFENKLKFLSGQYGEPIKEVLVPKEGESALEITRETFSDSSFDWAAFERRFGLDTVTDEQVEQGWHEFELQNGETESLFHDPPASDFDSEGTWTKPNKFESSNMSLEFLDDDVPVPDLKHHPSKQRTDNTAPSVPIPRPKLAPFENAAAEFDLDQRARKAPPNRKERNQPPDPLEQHLFSDPNPLEMQPNRKRPGYERRVASLEREMEKIVEQMLCAPQSEWSIEGGEVSSVLLSSNMQNLTIHYNSEGSRREMKWWKRFNKKYARMIRAEMASKLRMKYVPRVFFQMGDEEVSSKQELDALFQRIEVERAERVKSEGEIGTGE